MGRDCWVIADFGSSFKVCSESRTWSHPKAKSKVTDSDLSTNLNGIDEEACARITLVVQQIHADVSSTLFHLQR